MKNRVRSAIGMMALAAVCGGASLAQAQARLPRTGQDISFLTPASSLGITAREVTTEEAATAKLPRATGVAVGEVRDGTPAAAAGIRVGDVIVEFDGEPVRSIRTLARLVNETPPNRTVQVALMRDGTRHQLNVTPEAGRSSIAARVEIPEEIERGLRDFSRALPFDPEDMPRLFEGAMGTARLGVRLIALDDQLGAYFGVERGALVSSVEKESPADRAGLKAGDVITAVNGQRVEGPSDVTRHVRALRTADRIEVRVTRDKKEITLAVALPERERRTTRREGLPV